MSFRYTGLDFFLFLAGASFSLEKGRRFSPGDLPVNVGEPQLKDPSCWKAAAEKERARRLSSDQPFSLNSCDTSTCPDREQAAVNGG